MFGVVVWLENDAHAKQQLAHAVGRPGRSIRLNVGDLAGAAAAVEAGVALVRVEAQDRVVEEIVGVKPELRLYAFLNRKTLREGEVIREAAGPGEGIEAGVAKRAASRKSEWSRSRPRQ